jgi:Haemolysin secretion/activation protein ShlB/FhaC/HecB
VNAHNDADAFSLFSNGRITSGDYAYAAAQFTRTTRLPGQWTLVISLIGQYADHALPDTEQMGVGGADLVRGYTLDEGSYDSGIVARNDLAFLARQCLGDTSSCRTCTESTRRAISCRNSAGTASMRQTILVGHFVDARYCDLERPSDLQVFSGDIEYALQNLKKPLR